MKKILALTLPLLLAAWSARADVIWQEQFQYSNGPVVLTSTNTVGGVQVTNWLRFSGTANPSDMPVNNHKVEVWTTTGGGLPRQDDCGRMFSSTNNSIYTNSQQVVYISYIVNFSNLPSAAGGFFGLFKNGAPTSGNFQGKIWALTNGSVLPNTFRLGVSAAAGATPTICTMDLATNTEYQVVLQWDPVTLAALSLWINPISSSDPKVVSADSFTPTAANIANIYCFRQATGFGGFLTVSNMVLATTFSDSATNVWATNAVAPTIVYQPAAITTNFQSTATTISAVANGQGLANLTYQWQVSSSPANTSPADVSGANANILSVDTSTIGNKYFTLKVTTPWGLSTTSSVAKVAVLAPVGPPVFVTQPVSKTTFSGATVTLTTSVLSPGTAVYTWYSNNVVVTAGQADAGLSSSYTFTAPPVGSPATFTYKVAVTNETVVNGIVSTGAVVTVNPIQAVSIAFVRSLIDPVTLQATNSTTPYSVTGIITTLTNITSGDTCSYYVQDGTAGINIFATFGSTFRPAQGDQVTFVGVTSSFSSGMELFADTVNRTYTGYTINSSGNPLPAAKIIPFNLTNTTPFVYLATNTAGSLVTLQNVSFGTNTGVVISNTANQYVTVTNSSGTPFVLGFYYYDKDTAGQTLPAFASSVTGVLYGNTTNYSLAVTKFSDIVAASVPVLPIPLTVSKSGNVLTFSWPDASFNMQSQTNTLGVGLQTNSASWVNYPDTSNPLNVTIDPLAPTVFFRLIKP